jgi:hypothetical protein
MIWRRPRVSANEFALLVAIPLTRDEYADDERRPSDFIRSYVGSLPVGRSAWTAYAPYAEMCRRIVDEVERWGVTVIRRATLRSLASAVAGFKTVTLVAHARGPEIAAGDVVDVPRLRASLDDVWEELGIGGMTPGANDSIAGCLNSALGPDDIGEQAAPHPVTESEAFAWRVALYRERWRRRLVIEHLVPGALSGGPAIEFCEGLISITDVSEQLPRFDVLDLTVCDSVLLAECIRETHRDGVILCNPRPTTPDFRLAVYREAVRLATRKNTPYPDTLIRLRRYLKGQTA